MQKADASASARADASAWRLARRHLFQPVCALFVALSIACLAGLRIPDFVQYIPFAIGLVALGLPHGALDHLVPARLAGRPATAGTIAPVVALYGVLGALVIGLWWVAAPLAFVFFIGLTWLHWGQGDLFITGRGQTHPAAAKPGSAAIRRSSRAGARAATLVLRGALPMLVPLIAFPQAYLAVASNTTGVFGNSLPSAQSRGWEGDVLAALTSADGRIALSVALAVAAIGAIILNRPRSQQSRDDRQAAAGQPAQQIAQQRAWRADVVEVLVLALFFATVPPVLSVGLYFCLWHSLRHIVRLSLLDDSLRAPLVRGRFGLVFVRFTRQAAPVTLIALAILVGLYAVVPHAGTDLGSLLGLYLVLISALTLPHVVIVGLMDRVQARQAQAVAAATPSALV